MLSCNLPVLSCDLPVLSCDVFSCGVAKEVEIVPGQKAKRAPAKAARKTKMAGQLARYSNLCHVLTESSFFSFLERSCPVNGDD